MPTDVLSIEMTIQIQTRKLGKNKVGIVRELTGFRSVKVQILQSLMLMSFYSIDLRDPRILIPF